MATLESGSAASPISEYNPVATRHDEVVCVSTVGCENRLLAIPTVWYGDFIGPLPPVDDAVGSRPGPNGEVLKGLRR